MAKKSMVLLAMPAVAVPAMAQGDQGSPGSEQPVTVTGYLRTGPEAPQIPYTITDETTGATYGIDNARVGSTEPSTLVGQRVTATGVPQGGDSRPDVLSLSAIAPATGNPPPDPKNETLTLSFDLDTTCKLPGSEAFFGLVAQGGGTQLVDQGGGVYTGEITYPPGSFTGPNPGPPTVEASIVEGTPGSLGDAKTIKDFGQVTLDGDKTLKASYSSCDLPGGTTPESTTPGSTPPDTTTPESTTPESTMAPGTTGEQTRRDRRERTGNETTGNGTTPETTNSNSGTGNTGGSSNANGGGGGAANAAEGNGGSRGGVSGAVENAFGNLGRGRLPDTGGGWTVLLLAAAVLIGGGWLLVCRASTSR